MVRGKLKFLSYAPIVFISAKTGERAQKLFPLIDQVALARKRRISTPDLNRWLKEDVDLQRGSTPKARPVRIYYITQAKSVATHISSVHQPKDAPALQLRALSRKSAPRQVRFQRERPFALCSASGNAMAKGAPRINAIYSAAFCGVRRSCRRFHTFRLASRCTIAQQP